jgi:hypothetical protein
MIPPLMATHDYARRREVEPGGRLVEEQCDRVKEQREADGHAPAGQPRGVDGLLTVEHANIILKNWRRYAKREERFSL